MLRALVLTLALVASPALAESELAADIPAAVAAGFQFYGAHTAPAEPEMVTAVMTDLATQLGIPADAPASFTSWASPQLLDGGPVVMIVRARGVAWDAPGELGGRHFVFGFDNASWSWRPLLDISAMAIGVKQGEIAAVQESGFDRYVWTATGFEKRGP